MLVKEISSGLEFISDHIFSELLSIMRISFHMSISHLVILAVGVRAEEAVLRRRSQFSQWRRGTIPIVMIIIRYKVQLFSCKSDVKFVKHYFLTYACL